MKRMWIGLWIVCSVQCTHTSIQTTNISCFGTRQFLESVFIDRSGISVSCANCRELMYFQVFPPEQIYSHFYDVVKMKNNNIDWMRAQWWQSLWKYNNLHRRFTSISIPQSHSLTNPFYFVKKMCVLCFSKHQIEFES